MERLSVASAFYDVSGKPWYNDRNAIRLLNQMNDAQAWEKAEVQISRLIATQAFVNADFEEAAKAASRNSDGNGMAAIVLFDSRLYITDGHHRLYRDSCAGRFSAMTRLFNLDRALHPDEWSKAQTAFSFA